MRIALLAATGLFVGGCSTMTVDEFKSAAPEFRPEQYFLGKTTAWGLFEDRFGKVRRQFRVTVDGKMDGATLVLDEDFAYADGATETRLWRITRRADGRYEGRAAGVVGTATGQAAGNAFNWKYTYDLDVGGGDIWRVRFDDWMFAQPDGVVLNRAWVSRWGIEIGSVTIFFKKDEGAPSEG